MDTSPRKVIFLCGFVLLLLVLLNFVFIYAELFKYTPHIGIGFHLVGGFTVAFGVLYLFRLQMLLLQRYIQSIFMLGCVALAAVAWEGFEWVLSVFFFEKSLQCSLDNTMGDLYVGLAGGLLACVINYVKPLR